MALRYASKNVLITGTIGVLFPHGLGSVPDEYWLVAHGNTASRVTLISASSPDITNIYVSTGPGGGTISVFACTNHSVIK